MTPYVQKIAHLIGIDKAIAYTSMNGVLGAAIGCISVLFYTTFLTKEEQGYYYTFGSVMAISVFFELGFTGILTQYVAHEHAHLLWNQDGISLCGNKEHQSRLASLLRFCTKWYLVIAIAYFFIIQITGYYFFSKFGTNDHVSWKTPWILLCCFSALGLFLSPFSAFLNGLGLIKENAKMGFYRSLISTAFLWGSLFLGLGLHSLVISSIASTIFHIYYFIKHHFFHILLSLWKTQISERISYMKEIFPYQWRIALSWVSGYFIFNFINPVVFATDGAIVAGKIGLTINVLNSIRNLAMAWIGTKVPLMSRLIELKDYTKLDKIFRKTVMQEVLVGISLLIIFWVMIFALRKSHFALNGKIIADRFLDYFPMLLLTIPVIAQMVTDNLATYLRCHKKEPFLIQSICLGIISVAYIFIFGRIYGLMGICIGYFITFTFISLPWGYYIFKTKRKIYNI